MTFDEYQNAALRTASMGKGFEIETCIRALGLCGEATEFRDALHIGSAEDEIKEAGDILWYAATLAAAFNVRGDDLAIGDLAGVPHAGPGSCDSYAVAIMSNAGALAELVKKQIGHNKPANVLKVIDLLQSLLFNLALGSVPNLNAIAEANVAKLKARYPAGFDTAIASKKPDSTEKHMLGAQAAIEAVCSGGAVFGTNQGERCDLTDYGSCRYCGRHK